MKKLYLIVAALLLAGMTGMNSATGQPYDYFDTSFYSPILNETKSMRIYLPPGYNDDTAAYPVVYYLHCAGGSYLDLISYMPEIQAMIISGTIHPVILVGPDGQCEPFAGSLYTNSILYGNYEDYIIQEAIPFAESILRTKNSPDYRCIMGFAMGGYGSMKLALKHPGLFAGAASYNGPLQLDTLVVMWQPEVLAENPGPPYYYEYGAGIFTSLVFTASGAWSPNLNISPYQVEFIYDTTGAIIDSVVLKWKEHDCSRLAKNLDLASYYPGLFFACGINDFLFFHPTNVCFADTLNELGFDYEFLTTDDGHILSDEILAAGMHFLDSVMYDSLYVGVPGVAAGENYTLTIYPNPSSGQVHIRYNLSDSRRIVLHLCDLPGHEVMEIVNEYKRQGMYEEAFDLNHLPAGVYFVRFSAGDQVVFKKMIIQ